MIPKRPVFSKKYIIKMHIKEAITPDANTSIINIIYFSFFADPPNKKSVMVPIFIVIPPKIADTNDNR